MLDKAFFRKILQISAALCCLVSVATVAAWYFNKGASCPALVGTPLPIFITVALVWQAVFWRHTHDQIVSTRTQLDDIGFQHPLEKRINYNSLLMIVMAGFVGFSAIPLILYLVQCA